MSLTGPSEASGDSFECFLFEEDVACQRYELEPRATSLTGIAECNAAAVKAVTAKAVDLSTDNAAGVEAKVGGSTALMLEGIAAVGSSVLSELMLSTEEGCLAACALYISECTHVTVGTHALLLAFPLVLCAACCTDEKNQFPLFKFESTSNTYSNFASTRLTTAPRIALKDCVACV